MNRTCKLNKHWILWFSASKHEYTIAIYFQHGIINFEIPNYHYYSIAIAIFMNPFRYNLQKILL